MYFNIRGEIQNDPEVTETVITRDGRNRMRRLAWLFCAVIGGACIAVVLSFPFWLRWIR